MWKLDILLRVFFTEFPFTTYTYGEENKLDSSRYDTYHTHCACVFYVPPAF